MCPAGMLTQRFPGRTDFAAETAFYATCRDMTRFYVVPHVSVTLGAIITLITLETKPVRVCSHLGLDQIIQLLKSA